MNVEQAINLIEQGLNAASKQGTYSLQDAGLLSEAIKTIRKYTEPEKDSMDIVEEKDS